MEMHERIAFVRGSCRLSQEEFAERLGLTKSAISGYETGRRVPPASILRAISQRFQFNEQWLKTGEGEAIVPSSSDVLAALFDEFGCNDFEQAFLTSYLNLPDRERKAFSGYLEHLFCDVADELGYAKVQRKNSAAPAFSSDPASWGGSAPDTSADDDAEALAEKAAALVRDQANSEKKAESSA